jgi:genetic interactor of prohibitins 3, mitochondrial
VEHSEESQDQQNIRLPLCDRCHDLTHSNTGKPIKNPNVLYIRDAISASHHKYNHVYHVIDAADFPLSLIRGLHQKLFIAKLRAHNRRAQTHSHFKGQRQAEISFVITRSDLLAPSKEMVDSKMPYFIEVLRKALDTHKDIRLGNVSCVSSKRGWWTKGVKEEIWHRGGGNWLVGRVNVGKSSLFESVYPKNRLDEHWVRPIDLMKTTVNTSILPPLQPETPYPTMPIVSSLPGTTVSPIRVPFSKGKGEVVDLPGLSRYSFEEFVKPEHRRDLIMQTRVKPEQQVIKPGQSLLLDGLIRITPIDPELVFLSYSFVPLNPHITSTEKAIAIHTQDRESGLKTIVEVGVGRSMRLAKRVKLEWDITSRASGPMTAKSAAGLKVNALPYRVLAVDILIEGCGWVELTVQVRRKTYVPAKEARDEALKVDPESDSFEHEVFPEVEVFSPEGKGIGSRMPLGAWFLGAAGRAKSAQKGRPRASKKGEKKNRKSAARLVKSASSEH